MDAEVYFQLGNFHVLYSKQGLTPLGNVMDTACLRQTSVTEALSGGFRVRL